MFQHLTRDGAVNVGGKNVFHMEYLCIFGFLLDWLRDSFEVIKECLVRSDSLIKNIGVLV